MKRNLSLSEKDGNFCKANSVSKQFFLLPKDQSSWEARDLNLLLACVQACIRFASSIGKSKQEIPFHRLTKIGKFLLSSMGQGDQGLIRFCFDLSQTKHTTIPKALLSFGVCSSSSDLNLLQLAVQWRWRGQAIPISVERDLAHLCAALTTGGQQEILREMGKVAAWSLKHDWGNGVDARKGVWAATAFKTLILAGAQVEDINALVFRDFHEPCGLPVVLAMMRHGRPEEVLRLMDLVLGQGADPNAASFRGHTPLMECLNERLVAQAPDLVLKLFASGADGQMKNSNGLNLMDQWLKHEKERGQRAVMACDGLSVDAKLIEKSRHQLHVLIRSENDRLTMKAVDD